MTPFPLKIVTPDGVRYDGTAEEIVVRSITGELAVLAKHVDMVTPLGMGQALIVAGGQRRVAACIGGMLSVVGGQVTVLPTSFEWADQIDVARAEASQKRAEAVLNDKSSASADIRLAEARLRRALVRKSAAASK